MPSANYTMVEGLSDHRSEQTQTGVVGTIWSYIRINTGGDGGGLSAPSAVRVLKNGKGRYVFNLTEVTNNSTDFRIIANYVQHTISK